MTTEIHGGCACGASRYTCSERPLVQLICHCRDFTQALKFEEGPGPELIRDPMAACFAARTE